MKTQDVLIDEGEGLLADALLVACGFAVGAWTVLFVLSFLN